MLSCTQDRSIGDEVQLEPRRYPRHIREFQRDKSSEICKFMYFGFGGPTYANWYITNKELLPPQ